METFNLIAALGGLTMFFGAVILAFDLYTKRTLNDLIRRFGIGLGFGVAFGGVVMSLVYSEWFGLVPCGLCWFQRIFVYPQAFIFAAALYIKDVRAAAFYAQVLSFFGLVVALYQHYLQMGGAEFLECPTSGADCSQRFLFEFGFMTLPLIAAFSFLFLFVLGAYLRKVR